MITLAVIGCGRIAQSSHFPALSQMEDVRIKYACDLIEEKAAAMKEQYGAEQVITDYKLALADDEVQVVYVLTPNYSHYSITMDALNAGKHVFCEKPITVNLELAQQMQKLANEKGLLLNIGVCNRYHKSVCEIKDLVDSGKLGDVYHIYCSFRSHRSIPGLGGAFTTKAESGGGVLIDWGVHFFDLILFILGGAKIESVSANCYSKMAPDISKYKYENMWAGPPVPDGVNDVEDFVTGYIRTDRATISFNGAWAQNIGKNEMFIDFLGDKAGVRLDYAHHYEMFDNDLNYFASEGEIPKMHTVEDRAFIDAVKTGEKTVSHIDNVIESQKLLDAIYASSEQNKEIWF